MAPEETPPDNHLDPTEARCVLYLTWKDGNIGRINFKVEEIECLNPDDEQSKKRFRILGTTTSRAKMIRTKEEDTKE